MKAPDVSDTTANWFGDELCRIGDGAAALISFFRACELKPDDPINYVRFAEALSGIIRGIYRTNSRPVDHVDLDCVKTALTCAFSCSAISSAALNRARAVAEDTSVGYTYLQSLMTSRTGRNPSDQAGLLTRIDRVDAVRDIVYRHRHDR